MAPIKFEEHIKDKLQKREIKPSTSAWDRISDNLETPKEQRKLPFFWYGIAASFIGLLIVSILFFKSETPADVKKDVIVVDKGEKEIKDNKTKEALPVLKIDKENYVEIGSSKKDEILEKHNSKKGNTEEIGVLAQVEKRIPIEHKIQMVSDTSDKIIEDKLVEVLALANTMERNNDTLTDAEVDSLLRQAQRELLTNKLFREDNTVDAMALLSDVENELDQSFRDQIFEKLKTGFFKVRTAVADRNN